jgi:hypothetical protein
LREVSSFVHANPAPVRPHHVHVNRPTPSSSKDGLVSRRMTPSIMSIRGGGVGGGAASAPTSTQLQSTTFSAIASAVDTFWRTQPFAVAAIVCAIKACLADIVAQKLTHESSDGQAVAATIREQKRKTNQASVASATAAQSPNPFDWQRNLSFVLYGALYQGIAQEFIYNNFYNYLFGTGTNALTVTKKVLFDAVAHNALICIPMAYILRGFVSSMSSMSSSKNKSTERISLSSVLPQALRKYKHDVLHRGLLKKYYALWMPVNCMIFTIVPKHFRITVMATISFFWIIILSSISSQKRD